MTCGTGHADYHHKTKSVIVPKQKYQFYSTQLWRNQNSDRTFSPSVKIRSPQPTILDLTPLIQQSVVTMTWRESTFSIFRPYDPTSDQGSSKLHTSFRGRQNPSSWYTVLNYLPVVSLIHRFTSILLVGDIGSLHFPFSAEAATHASTRRMLDPFISTGSGPLVLVKTLQQLCHNG